MRRRDFASLFGAALGWPGVLLAESPKKLPKVAFLGNATPALEAALVEAFRQGLRDFGYNEGEDVLIVYRWAEGRYERFPALIAELISAKVNVIVTAGTPASLAVQRATKTIPVVMIAVGDPVGTGLVASLGRPGGNITGLTSIAPELEGKRLELMREVMPTVSHVAVLWNPVNPFQLTSIKQLTTAAQAMRIRLLSLEARSLKEIEQAFATMIKERPQALFVLADRVFLHNRVRIMEFATRQRLPGVHAYRELVHAGGLMSYGPSYEEMHRRAGSYVNVILKGADPAKVPVQRPMKFNLVLNMRTARALGLNIPESVLVRADEVIE